MKVLITGATGFVAPYLEEELLKNGFQVVKTALTAYHRCDLSNKSAVYKLINRVRPQCIVHLAGLSHTDERKFLIDDYVRANLSTSYNLCSAFSSLPGLKTFLFVSSGMVYGVGQRNKFLFSETSPVAPVNLYGVSKLAAERAIGMFDSQRLQVYIARPFNHIGPHQAPTFVASAFAKRIRDSRPSSIISVGGLSAYRDFSDVRDIVRAYVLIIKKQPRQRLFVLGSGRLTKIEDILKKLIRISGKNIQFKVEEKLSTSRSISKLGAVPDLAKLVLGWETNIPLDQSLKDLYWN